MIEEQTKILRFMGEMTGRVDMNEFAKKMGLTTSQILQHMQDLSKKGFLKKVGGGFAMTDKGKNALKAILPVSDNEKFEFYTEIGNPASLSARTAMEFHDAVLKVDSRALAFHLSRGDFENWFNTAVGDAEFAGELSKIRKMNLNCEDLRKTIARAAETRYSL